MLCGSTARAADHRLNLSDPCGVGNRRLQDRRRRRTHDSVVHTRPSSAIQARAPVNELRSSHAISGPVTVTVTGGAFTSPTRAVTAWTSATFRPRTHRRLGERRPNARNITRRRKACRCPTSKPDLCVLPRQSRSATGWGDTTDRVQRRRRPVLPTSSGPRGPEHMCASRPGVID